MAAEKSSEVKKLEELRAADQTRIRRLEEELESAKNRNNVLWQQVRDMTDSVVRLAGNLAGNKEPSYRFPNGPINWMPPFIHDPFFQPRCSGNCGCQR